MADLDTVLELRQVRRRVYVHDRDGAVATLTLDQATCGEWGANARFTEVEIELNELRYTAADVEQRRWLTGVLATLQSDLLGKFPAIVQDQTSKYAKAFDALQAKTILPLRRLVAWRCKTEHLVVVGGLLGAGLLALIWRLSQRRPAAAAPVRVAVRDFSPTYWLATARR